jgi:putative Holliday junction resolvase
LLIADLVRIVADEEPDVVVLGLPLNMDGSVGPRAELVRRFVAALRTALTAAATRGGRTPAVVFVDERLTSAEAEWQLAGSGLTRGQKKKRRDALAAAAILRSYFAEGPWGDEATGRNAPGEDSADVGDD